MRRWWEEHTLLGSWLLLAAGMVAILLVASREVELLAMQRFWMVVATILLAALCAWIISWEDEPHDDEADAQR